MNIKIDKYMFAIVVGLSAQVGLSKTLHIGLVMRNACYGMCHLEVFFIEHADWHSLMVLLYRVAINVLFCVGDQ